MQTSGNARMKMVKEALRIGMIYCSHFSVYIFVCVCVCSTNTCAIYFYICMCIVERIPVCLSTQSVVKIFVSIELYGKLRFQVSWGVTVKMKKKQKKNISISGIRAYIYLYIDSFVLLLFVVWTVSGCTAEVIDVCVCGCGCRCRCGSSGLLFFMIVISEYFLLHKSVLRLSVILKEAISEMRMCALAKSENR